MGERLKNAIVSTAEVAVERGGIESELNMDLGSHFQGIAAEGF